MEKIGWTESQKQRLKELNAGQKTHKMSFSDPSERDKTFLTIESRLTAGYKRILKGEQNKVRPSLLFELESRLVDFLGSHGFVQVSTPLIISKGFLEKMSVDETHPLFRQVFWLSEKKCLRPMLAPNLYFLLKELARVWDKPVKIFEIGPCFRKDSAGKLHDNEFTMLNLVELGLPEKKGEKRLKELANGIMKIAGVGEYSLSLEESNIYGKTIDIIVDNIEIASSALGPHKLDSQWGIRDPWVGIGLGLERLLMVREKYQNIQKAGRSLSYLNGIRLNV